MVYVWNAQAAPGTPYPIPFQLQLPHFPSSPAPFPQKISLSTPQKYELNSHKYLIFRNIFNQIQTITPPTYTRFLPLDIL